MVRLRLSLLGVVLMGYALSAQSPLSEMDRLKAENLSLKQQALQATAVSLQLQYQQIQEKLVGVEAQWKQLEVELLKTVNAEPGCTWDRPNMVPKCPKAEPPKP